MGGGGMIPVQLPNNLWHVVADMAQREAESLEIAGPGDLADVIRKHIDPIGVDSVIEVSPESMRVIDHIIARIDSARLFGGSGIPNDPRS